MSIADAAAFVAQAWPCFPCAGKVPLVKWRERASRDDATVRAMFATRDATGIGVPMGEGAGVFLVDLDVKNGGAGLEWLAANNHRLPSTRTHTTPSGGLHLLFAWPEGRAIRNSASAIAPGVDIRGDGGFAIFPPTSGYLIDSDAMPAAAPAWLLDLIDPPAPPKVAVAYTPPSRVPDRYAEAALDGECQAVASAGEGTRNDRLNVAAVKLGSLVAAGALDRRTVEYELKRAALHAGLDPRETDLTIASGLGYGLTQPRQIPERPAPQRHSAQLVSNSAQSDNPTQITDGGQPRHLPLLFLDDIQPCLDASDFVEGVLVEQSAAVIYGESNAGKTFFATDLALSVSAGEPWFGREVDQGGVVYCVLEGGFGFRNRVRAWLDFNGRSDSRLPFAAIPSGINLLDPDADTPRLIDAIKTAAAAFEMPVKLVVIDTLARAFAGGNENSSEDMGRLVLNMDAIRQATGACVLFIHHSGKDQARGARGHSSLRAAIDTEIEVKEAEGARTASLVKQRDLPKGDEIEFALKVVELGKNRRGKPVTTCVVTQPEAQADGAPAKPKRAALSGDTRLAYEILCDAIATDGMSGSAGVPTGTLSIPEDWWRERFYSRAKPGASQEAKQKAFRRAADGLMGTKHAAMNRGRVWITEQ